MYSNILIPIAFDAEKDVAGAIEIAKRISAEGASITFLHVMEQVPAYVARGRVDFSTLSDRCLHELLA